MSKLGPRSYKHFHLSRIWANDSPIAWVSRKSRSVYSTEWIARFASGSVLAPKFMIELVNFGIPDLLNIPVRNSLMEDLGIDMKLFKR